MEIVSDITQEDLNKMSLDDLEALNTDMEGDLKEYYDNSMKKMVLKALEDKERLDELIGKLKVDDFLVVDLKGIEVKIQRTLTRAQRREVMKAEKEELTEEESEEIMCGFLAEICLEEPFNRKESWEEVDKETGKVLEIYVMANDILMEEMEAVRGFRNEGGPGPGRDAPPVGGPKKPAEIKQI